MASVQRRREFVELPVICVLEESEGRSFANYEFVSDQCSGKRKLN